MRQNIFLVIILNFIFPFIFKAPPQNLCLQLPSLSRLCPRGHSNSGTRIIWECFVKFSASVVVAIRSFSSILNTTRASVRIHKPNTITMRNNTYFASMLTYCIEQTTLLLYIVIATSHHGCLHTPLTSMYEPASHLCALGGTSIILGCELSSFFWRNGSSRKLLVLGNTFSFVKVFWKSFMGFPNISRRNCPVNDVLAAQTRKLINILNTIKRVDREVILQY